MTPEEHEFSASTWGLYYEYMGLVLLVHVACTVSTGGLYRYKRVNEPLKGEWNELLKENE